MKTIVVRKREWILLYEHSCTLVTIVTLLELMWVYIHKNLPSSTRLNHESDNHYLMNVVWGTQFWFDSLSGPRKRTPRIGGGVIVDRKNEAVLIQVRSELKVILLSLIKKTSPTRFIWRNCLLDGNMLSPWKGIGGKPSHQTL